MRSHHSLSRYIRLRSLGVSAHFRSIGQPRSSTPQPLGPPVLTLRDTSPLRLRLLLPLLRSAWDKCSVHGMCKSTTLALLAVLLCSAACRADLFDADSQPASQDRQRQQQQERNLDYALRRGLWLPVQLGEALDSRERRAASAAGSSMGSSFIRFGRSEAVSQPQTRSDLIIRYGRDGLNGRLTKLRQERMRRLARLALICAAKNQDDAPANSAEEKILREICKDAPLHPTVPDFV